MEHPLLLPNFLAAFRARGCLCAAGQSQGSVGALLTSSLAAPLGRVFARSCVALQALPAVRVNKLTSTVLWLRVALWGRGEDPILLLSALPLGAGGG